MGDIFLVLKTYSSKPQRFSVQLASRVRERLCTNNRHARDAQLKLSSLLHARAKRSIKRTDAQTDTSQPQGTRNWYGPYEV